MHQLIASPFLEQHVLVRPGSRGGALLPEDFYEDLRALAPTEPAPAWLLDVIREQWADLDVTDQYVGEFLLVRQPCTSGYSKASWEINLGCNYACKMCYLGLKVFSGMAWEDKRRCLDLMAESGVLWLQMTGGCRCRCRVPRVCVALRGTGAPRRQHAMEDQGVSFLR